MLRSAVFSLLLLLPLVGCSVVRVQGEQFDLYYPWWLTILIVGLGLALMGIGVPLVLGRWKPKGKPRVTGAIALLAGGTIAVFTAISVPYERVTITPEKVVVTRGTFSDRRIQVQLHAVQRIVLYKARRARDNPRHSAGPTTFIELVPAVGASTHMRMKEPQRTPAIEHLIELAERLGIEVDDQRDQYDPLRRLRGS